jgi:hypothetical protein
MILPEGGPSPLNLGEIYQGAVVGSTVVIQSYSNAAYDGPWVVTASTNPPGPPFESPFTFSFTASGLGTGDCTDFQLGTACIAYQQGTQITDGGILWQYAGPQDEVGPTVVVTPSPYTVTTEQALDVTVAVGGGGGEGRPTGTVTLTSGSYSSSATPLTESGLAVSATINVPAGKLAVGLDTLTAAYSGDDNYNPATGINAVTVTGTGPSFTLSAVPISLSIVQGSMGTSTITVTPSGGFTGSVTLEASGLPSGVTAAFNPSSTTTTSTLTLTASSSATVGGPTTVTITGTSGSLTATTTVALTVTSPTGSFTLSVNPTTVTISAPGQSGTTKVTVTPTGGFTGQVNIACTLPASMTESTCPAVVADITNSNPVTAMVTITTTAPQAGAIRAVTTGIFGFGVLAGVFVFAIPGWRRRAPLALLLLGIVVLIVSCGGSSGTGPSNLGTPPGTYTVTLTATSGSVSPPPPTTFQVVVQ